MVDREIDIDAWDGNETHVAVAAHIEAGVVGLRLFLLNGPLVGLFGKIAVIEEGIIPHLLILLGVQGGNRLGIADDCTRLVKGVPVITEGRICNDCHTGQQDQHQQEVYPAPLFLLSFLFICHDCSHDRLPCPQGTVKIPCRQERKFKLRSLCAFF